jgi:hypothetical protein
LLTEIWVGCRQDAESKQCPATASQSSSYPWCSCGIIQEQLETCKILSFLIFPQINSSNIQCQTRKLFVTGTEHISDMYCYLSGSCAINILFTHGGRPLSCACPKLLVESRSSWPKPQVNRNQNCGTWFSPTCSARVTLWILWSVIVLATAAVCTTSKI